MSESENKTRTKVISVAPYKPTDRNCQICYRILMKKVMISFHSLVANVIQNVKWTKVTTHHVYICLNYSLTYLRSIFAKENNVESLLDNSIKH